MVCLPREGYMTHAHPHPSPKWGTQRGFASALALVLSTPHLATSPAAREGATPQTPCTLAPRYPHPSPWHTRHVHAYLLPASPAARAGRAAPPPSTSTRAGTACWAGAPAIRAAVPLATPAPAAAAAVAAALSLGAAAAAGIPATAPVRGAAVGIGDGRGMGGGRGTGAHESRVGGRPAGDLHRVPVTGWRCLQFGPCACDRTADKYQRSVRLLRGDVRRRAGGGAEGGKHAAFNTPSRCHSSPKPCLTSCHGCRCGPSPGDRSAGHGRRPDTYPCCGCGCGDRGGRSPCHGRSRPCCCARHHGRSRHACCRSGRGGRSRLGGGRSRRPLHRHPPLQGGQTGL